MNVGNRFVSVGEVFAPLGRSEQDGQGWGYPGSEQQLDPCRHSDQKRAVYLVIVLAGGDVAAFASMVER